MLLKIALGFAHLRSPAHRWRQCIVPLTAFLFTLGFLVAAGLQQMEIRVQERAQARAGLEVLNLPPDVEMPPELAGHTTSVQSETDLLVRLSFESIGNLEQVTVVWIEPAGSQQPVLPPGIEALPPPGTYVVSPALARRISERPDLAQRYGAFQVLPDEAVQSGEELFAYATPPDGRTIKDSVVVIRVASFGESRSNLDWNYVNPLGRPLMAVGTFICIVLPGLFFLAVGLTSASPMRDNRFLVLHAIGIRRTRLILLGILEALVLAMPGILLAPVVWMLALQRQTYLPLVDRHVLPGDLALSSLTLVSIVMLAMLFICVLAALLVSWQLRTSKKPRPTITASTLSWKRTVPFAASFIPLVTAQFMPNTELGGILTMVAITMAIVTFPLIYTHVIRLVGDAFAGLRTVPAIICGRQLSWDPIRITRPFAALGTVVMVFAVLIGVGTIFRAFENPTSVAGAVSAATLSWVDPKSGDIDQVNERLDGAFAIPFRSDEDGITIGATCMELETSLDLSGCDAKTPYAVSLPLSEVLSSLMMHPGPFRLAEPMSLGTNGFALVIGKMSGADLDIRIANATAGLLPVPIVDSISANTKSYDDRNDWLIGAGLISLVFFGLSATVSLVDRLMSTQGNRQVLLRIGLAHRRLRVLEGWLFALPYCTVLGISLAMGTALCWLVLRRQHLAIPWLALGALATTAFAVGVLGTMAVALLGAGTGEQHRSRGTR